MRKMFIALTVIVTSLTGLAFSSDNGFFNADKAFKSGIDQYNSADYPGAAESFSSIIDHGLKSGNVYFNLGNCRLKEGKIGQAILSFERARLFIPRDRDLVSNIGIARELIKQKEILETLERTSDRIEDVSDVLKTIIIKMA